MIRLGVRGRLMTASIAVLGAGLVLLSLGVNVLLTKQLSGDASSVLRNRAGAQLATLDTRGGRVRLNEAPNDGAVDQQAWVFAAGRALEQPRADPAVARAAVDLTRARGAVERTVGAMRLLSEPVYDPASRRRIGTVVVGLSLVPYRHTENIALVSTLALDAFVLLIGGLVVGRAMSGALRPVAEMTERASEWSEHDLHRRFDMGPAHDELTGLAATLDGMLGRIDAVIRHEQRFSAEVAHELRTPLSSLRAEAELALRSGQGEADLREGMRRVLAYTERMATAIETLLLMARSDSTSAVGSCDPFVPVQEVVGSLEAAASAHDVELQIAGAPGLTMAGADGALVAQVVHPLIDNGIRHAARRVEVRVGGLAGEVRIAVRDDGPGVPAAETDRIF
ncbi:MAG: histidine kinase, partial [Solirubrobacterales bacterium]|nr:histidine kinase [Solirubrobacterales bacterium]